ncbi:hypothetical protein GH714_038138 [Hevea brasiliensis]|uniref:Fungal lipase-type domain-containing protein n=1 Tax=Hevea brasiliensis TaxID=3981 RepID=A0A6A6MN08_HEVBR|nr:hypothetical protein GH714_038138 [Hevea brasiliensis]
MQISASLPAQNLHLVEGFRYRQSPLNPSRKPTSASMTQSLKPPVTSTESESSTKKHIANLEKLLRKHSIPELNQPEPVQPVHKVSNGNNNRSTLANKGKALLERLNLARIWPEMRAAEEMSPRHLNRLQRLLSKTEEYSPRNNIGSRWREYHGSNDWTGLLDPLDENLRREVVRYGEFVQAAYHAFHSNPAMSSEEAPLPRHIALPDRSYKVTKSLYATSSIGLPKWVDDVAPDLGWMTQRSSWVGYVAICDDKRDPEDGKKGYSDCITRHIHVECGFLSLHKTGGAHVPCLAESVMEEVKRLMEQYKGETLSITVTGHSLGAALALLVADDLSTQASEMPPIVVFSFGGPRVGNRGFANQINAKNVKVLRIVNNQDVITKVPGLPMVAEINEDLPLAYSHVGIELRVDTKMSPYLKPNADVACCHDLEAYLHLVDGFLASNCPFRANAKRSLVKLLNDQRSNVKKLYTAKAHALSLNLDRQGFSSAGCLPSPSQ